MSGQDLRDQIAEAIWSGRASADPPVSWATILSGNRPGYRADTYQRADFVLAVVQPELDARDIVIGAVNDALRTAGIEYPLGARGISDLADQRDGQQERAEEAEAEQDRLHAGEEEIPQEPGSWMTPGQWIKHWNGLDAAGRLELATLVLANAQHATQCLALDKETP